MKHRTIEEHRERHATIEIACMVVMQLVLIAAMLALFGILIEAGVGHVHP